MIDDERTWAVKRMLFDYVKSPSLKHIRDPYSITKLAQEIVKRLDRGNVDWKWTQIRKSKHWYCRTNGRSTMTRTGI